jgi:hypothetical protein
MCFRHNSSLTRHAHVQPARQVDASRSRCLSCWACHRSKANGCPPLARDSIPRPATQGQRGAQQYALAVSTVHFTMAAALCWQPQPVGLSLSPEHTSIIRLHEEQYATPARCGQWAPRIFAMCSLPRRLTTDAWNAVACCRQSAAVTYVSELVV